MDNMVDRRLAVILARGGSKRLPRKNILPLNGKPMLAWTIIAALESECFENVLVSTDDAEIEEVAINFGAEVPFLRSSATDDHAPSSFATYIALQQAEAYWKTKFTVVAQLMANCPFRTANVIRASISAFDTFSAPSQISCFRFGWMNPWWASTLSEDGTPKSLFPDASTSRSQDLPALYCPSGALWIARREPFMETKNFYMKGHRFEPIDWISALDIDDEQDMDMARAVSTMRKVTSS